MAFSTSGLFSTRFSGSLGEDDTKGQARLQSALDKKKRIKVKNPQSSRYSIDPDESGATGIYDSTEMASMWADPSATNFNVASTAIQDIDYNPKTKNLRIRFQGGNQWYDYPDVPAEVVAEWMDSPSKGKAFHVLIEPYSTAR